VKHWKETAEILGRVGRLAEAGQQAALATVVHIEGSAYRRAGAKFLVEEDGRTSGGVSGGCLEADVREVALEVLREGIPRLIHYDTGDDDTKVWGLGLGCNGSVDIFVQPATLPAAMEVTARVADLLAGELPFAVSTIVRSESHVGSAVVVGAEGIVSGSTGDGGLDREVARRAAGLLARGESRLDEIRSLEVFTEVQTPPPHLVVFGAGDDAIPICAYAADAGFRVSVVDHRQAYLSSERFPGATRLYLRRAEEGTDALPLGPRTYAVVKTHSLAQDREWVRRLLATEIPYIGLLGPRARKAEILSEVGGTVGERVYGPVGLDVGAEGPEQIAVSIVAELLAVQSSRDPWHLREREGAIHAT
jgi:xanthine/CO dehydrogenase XdhC/CoxF family maturation factor